MPTYVLLDIPRVGHLLANTQLQGTFQDYYETTLLPSSSSATVSLIGSLQVFFLAMILYPEVQSRAQAELAKVIGRDRLPRMSDYNDLPYMKALITEVFRWRPIVTLGFPHQSLHDDEFQGYHIPAGSLIFTSSW